MASHVSLGGTARAPAGRRAEGAPPPTLASRPSGLSAESGQSSGQFPGRPSEVWSQWQSQHHGQQSSEQHAHQQPGQSEVFQVSAAATAFSKVPVSSLRFPSPGSLLRWGLSSGQALGPATQSNKSLAALWQARSPRPAPQSSGGAGATGREGLRLPGL